MTIEIKPEVKAAIDKRLQTGAFHDVDELLIKALDALSENGEPDHSHKPTKRLIDVLTSPAFAGSELQIERLKEFPQHPIDL